MNRRQFLQAGAAPPAIQTPQLTGHGRPNALFIMADQFRLDCLGANGNRIISPPNLDRLASDAANFSNVLVQAPVCVPSRLSYFTGRYPHSQKNREQIDLLPTILDMCGVLTPGNVPGTQFCALRKGRS